MASQQAALAAQQQEIQALRDELHHKDQAVKQVQARPPMRRPRPTRRRPVEPAAGDRDGAEKRRD